MHKSRAAAPLACRHPSSHIYTHLERCRFAGCGQDVRQNKAAFAGRRQRRSEIFGEQTRPRQRRRLGNQRLAVGRHEPVHSSLEGLSAAQRYDAHQEGQKRLVQLLARTRMRRCMRLWRSRMSGTNHRSLRAPRHKQGLPAGHAKQTPTYRTGHSIWAPRT